FRNRFMVTNITSLSGNGARDWLIQRVSALILGLYTLFLTYYFVTHAPINYMVWVALFSHPVMKAFSFLALLSLVTHAWVGIWTVLTDYLKCACLRVFIQVFFILALLLFLAWGVAILWSV